MRTPVFVCAAVLSCASPSFADGLGVGVKSGVNVATQHATGSDAGASLQSQIGAVFGGFVTLPLASRIDVEADALYSMKGAKLEIAGAKSNLLLDYFEVPVLGRYRLGEGRRRYFVAGGASIATRLRARVRTQFAGSTETVDVADQIERLDFGVVAGGGVEVGSLSVEGRYTHGLKDVDQDKADKSKTNNRSISVLAGFRF